MTYKLYNRLFIDIITEPHRLIALPSDTFMITHLGRQVANIGFKNYIENLENKSNLEQLVKESTLHNNNKGNSYRGWITIILALIGLIIGVSTPSFGQTKRDYSQILTTTITKWECGKLFGLVLSAGVSFPYFHFYFVLATHLGLDFPVLHAAFSYYILLSTDW